MRYGSENLQFVSTHFEAIRAFLGRDRIVVAPRILVLNKFERVRFSLFVTFNHNSFTPNNTLTAKRF